MTTQRDKTADDLARYAAYAADAAAAADDAAHAAAYAVSYAAAQSAVLGCEAATRSAHAYSDEAQAVAAAAAHATPDAPQAKAAYYCQLARHAAQAADEAQARARKCLETYVITAAAEIAEEHAAAVNAVAAAARAAKIAATHGEIEKARRLYTRAALAAGCLIITLEDDSRARAAKATAYNAMLDVAAVIGAL